MKALIRILILVTITTMTVMGCGKSSDKNNATAQQCDAFGNCYPGYPGYPGTPGYPGYPGTAVGKDAILLEGGITVSSSNAWKGLLDGFLNCKVSFMDTCGMINNASPRMNIVINDYLFRGANNTSSGTVTIFSQQIPALTIIVNWRKTSGDTAIDTQVLAPYEEDNKYMKVVLTGLVTDAEIPVELYYGNSLNSSSTLVGRGKLIRMNR